VRLLPAAEHAGFLLRFGLEPQDYGLVTLHRPSTVDDSVMLQTIMSTLQEIAHNIPLVFPIHPRTRHRLEKTDYLINGAPLRFVDPLGYLDFLALQKHARFVITDSGGIQEETTYLGIPCLTVRKNTERPVTVTVGTNTLVGQDVNRLRQTVGEILDGQGKRGSIPPLWDGHAGERIANIIATL